jgi:hypothetical protein
MESIGTCDRVAPVARSPLDSARGRRRKRSLPTHPPSPSSEGGFPVARK